ncbi:hypothetical protein TPHA_0B04810 [Tetrapisispora phaffii CBS 4417]|uniref:Peptide-methionine (R)-S-oxide reductase n=1 Tax=Tetrapisispora phaffii (strain ATCC 24235 / CBS 4417 / NBRC 1672 / NRRL Y-8282 / UCD 70-5) TaxID=1071381 RepID=G8BQ69_TETPH|nr:hypothetical protein TPHA_0B04810 [Tetrapisispora phaffii CBS 4417]CCE62150.1 hypothetical protein TPHA_0B04810 [Tetrapisispora phaffii CBS 4417]
MKYINRVLKSNIVRFLIIILFSLLFFNQYSTLIDMFLGKYLAKTPQVSQNIRYFVTKNPIKFTLNNELLKRKLTNSKLSNLNLSNYSKQYSTGNIKGQQQPSNKMSAPETPDIHKHWNKDLSPEALHILRDKGTEAPNTGAYLHNKRDGIYTCGNCMAPIYDSNTKFDSGCGWPAFYKEIPGALKHITDLSHGMKRVEITCAKCGGHMGHVFEGEGFDKLLGNPTDERHCVNSASLKFKPRDK